MSQATGRSETTTGGRIRAAAARSSALFVFWLMLSGGAPGDLPAGVVATAAAVWTSLRLLPPGSLTAGHVRFAALPGAVLRFLSQSAVAGADVARRALDPRLPLRPGFVVYPMRLPPGTAQSTFTTLISLLPGTVPAGSVDGGGLLVHCLDTGQPVAAQLAEAERLLIHILGGAPRDG
jgi:multicomponent Na+:H+ antiporter subunit E